MGCGVDYKNVMLRSCSNHYRQLYSIKKLNEAEAIGQLP